MLVTTDFLPNVSGIATLSYEQAVGLAGRNHQVRVLTATAPGAGGPTYGADNLQIERFLPSQRPIFRLYNLLKAVRNCIHSFGPDFIWCTNYRGFGLPVMVGARQQRIPYGIYFHGTELITEYRSSLRRKILSAVARQAAVVCTNSINTSGLLRSNFGINGIPATPGVHVNDETDNTGLKLVTEAREAWLRENNLDQSIDPIILIAVCRISRQKGLHVAVKAIASLPAEIRRRVLYVIVGTGPDVAELRTLVKALGLEKQICFTGPAARSEVPTLLAAADVYLQPSQPEGSFLESFGISFLEAQAKGKPCIATRWGGIPEAVRDGLTAVLVPTDSVTAVADAILSVVNDREWRVRAGDKAREWAQLNSWDRHVMLVESLIASAQPAPGHE